MFDSLDASRNVSLDSGLQLFSGSVSQFDLHDYSTIQLNNRSSLYVSAFGLNADAELNLLNRDGNRIAVSNQSGSSAESIGIILEPGTYYIDVHYGSGSTSYQMSLSSNPLFANLDDSVDWLTGEFNGDGFKDVIRQEKGNLVNGIDDVQFFLGKSDGSFQAPVQMENMAAMHGNGVNLIAGDFNGDRKTDLIRQEKDSWINGENDVQFLTFQNGNFQVVANAPYMDTLTGNYVNLIAGDFNGDGRTDLIRQEKGAIVNGLNDVQVLLSNGNWGFQPPIQMNNMSIMTGNDVTLVSSGGADLMRLEKGASVNGDNDVQFYTFNNGNFQWAGNNPTTAFSGVALPVNGESQNIAATLTSSDPFASAINRVGGASVVGTSYNQVHIWGDANVQDFNGGAEGRGILMQRNGTNTAYWISGDIWEKYYSVQGPAGSLGYATSDRYAFNGGWKQDFEGGFITKTAQGVISSSIDVQPIQPISPPSVTPVANSVPLSIQQQFQDSVQKYPHFLGQAQTGIVNQGNNVWRQNFEKGYLVGSNNRVTLFQYEGSLSLAGIDATVWRPPTPPANINQIFQNTALQYANILGAPLTGIKDGSDGFKQQTFTDYILVWEGGNTVEIRPILDITPGWLKAINDQIARDNAIDITPDWLKNASNQPATNSPIIDLTPPGWQNNNQPATNSPIIDLTPPGWQNNNQNGNNPSTFNAQTAEEQVRQIFREVLGREVDAGGLQHYVSGAAAGRSFDDIRSGIASSDESRGKINQIFQDVLGRDADAPGTQHYIEELTKGRTLSSVRSGVAASDEAGRDINQFYKDILRRDADATGLQHYRNMLTQGWNLAQVQSDIANSQEARNLGGVSNPPPNGVSYIFNTRFYREDNLFWRAGYAPASTNPSFTNLGNAQGNCTWYVNGRLKELGYDASSLDRLTGYANDWDNQAQAAGIQMSNTPQVGAIAQWESGHVAVVERVNADGTILISESSYSPVSGSSYDYLYKTETISAASPSRYIHVPRSQPFPLPVSAPEPEKTPIRPWKTEAYSHRYLSRFDPGHPKYDPKPDAVHSEDEWRKHLDEVVPLDKDKVGTWKQDWSPNPLDYALAKTLSTSADLAYANGEDDGAELLQHWLYGKGIEKTISLEEAMNESSGIRNALKFDVFKNEIIREIKGSILLDGYSYGNIKIGLQGANDWWDLLDKQDKNWYLALGNFDFSYTFNFTWFPDGNAKPIYETDTRSGNIRLEIDLELIDVYKFEEKTVPLYRLHKTDLAHNFIVKGHLHQVEFIPFTV